MKISLSHALRIIDCATFLPVTNALVYSHTAKTYAEKKDGGFYIFTSPLIRENDSIEIKYKEQTYSYVIDERIKTLYINKENTKSLPVLISTNNTLKGTCNIPCDIIGFGGDIVIDGLFCKIGQNTHKIQNYSDGVLTLQEPVHIDVKVCTEIVVVILRNCPNSS